MRSKLALPCLSALRLALFWVRSRSALAADPPKEKITYQDHVSAVFRSRCGSCHNPDKQKGGLNLDNYGSAMQGGGSGKVIEPGDAENSTLFLVISHKEEPKMPPNSPKIPDAEIELIRKWIEGGALENSGSMMAAKAKPKFEFKLDPAALGKPAGTPAMPENLTTEPFVPEAKPNAVVAMASSPWAPLVAVAGHKQVLLYRTTDLHLVGRPAVSRRGDLRPQVQPQRRPALGRRRPRRSVRHRGRLGRQERNPSLRGRQGVRRCPGGRHQPRPQPGRPGRSRQGRAESTTRPTDRWRRRCASTPSGSRPPSSAPTACCWRPATATTG